jgi:GNAT superfamily N-acetyltransferase
MLSIRRANIADAALLRTLIRELAEFERELELCVIEVEDLQQDGFGEAPKFHALIAEWSGEPAGYALFFGYYSSWVGRGLYLEDVFVRPQFRGKGIGMGLLAAAAKFAVQGGYRAMRWEVLDWNENAIGIYKALGAKFRDQWRSVLLKDEALRRLAERTP